MKMNKLKKAHKILFKRYLKKLNENKTFNCGTVSSEHLISMCNVALENILTWPIDKCSRWLGFVQGVMIVQGVLEIDKEREFSRPLFHEAYNELNIKIPKTCDLVNKHK